MNGSMGDVAPENHSKVKILLKQLGDLQFVSNSKSITITIMKKNADGSKLLKYEFPNGDITYKMSPKEVEFYMNAMKTENVLTDRKKQSGTIQ